MRALRLLPLALAAFACQPAPAEQAPEPAPTAAEPATETPAAEPHANAPAPTSPAKIAAPVAPPAPVGSIKTTVIPQFGQLLTTGPRQLDLLIRLEGIGEVAGTRPPLDLALVIDRSGSMSGDKLRHVKTAALQLLDSLQPTDTVTLISYSDDVKRHTTRLSVAETGREVLRNHVLGLDSGGSTALGPALIQALTDLEAGLNESRLTHALLLSDGLANVGEQNPQVLGARTAQAFTKGISVSTLGVGLDYNEDLMTRLADQGGGRYHFIEDGDKVAGILDDEMKGLVATVARSIELQFMPTAGTGVAKVFGYPTTREGNTVRARVGSVAATRTRDIIVRLALPELAAPQLDLGAIAVHYTDVTADAVPRKIHLPLRTLTTADTERARKSENAEVTVRVAEVEAAERLEVAARAADRGDFEGARGGLQIAIDDLKEKQARAPSPKLEKQIVELEEARDEVAEAKKSSKGRKAYTKKFKSKAYKTRKK